MIGFGEWTPMLAELEVKVQGQPLGKIPGLLMRDIVMIVMIGVGLLLALMVVVRYFYMRRPKKKHVAEARKVCRGSSEQEEKEEREETAEREAEDSRRRYKYRWKRRQHRVRKPTLAETGGLPPPRPQEPTQPS